MADRPDESRRPRFRLPFAARVNRKLRQRRPLRARLPSPARLADAAFRHVRQALPRLAALAAVGAVVTGGVLAVRWVRRSPRFAVTELVVSGHARVTADELLARSGVARGQNLFSVSLADVERRLEAHPWVEEARATRHLPHRIALQVVERRPAGVVVASDSYLADRQGRLFARARLERGDGDDLPIVTGVDRELWAREPAAAEALVRHALELMARWQANPERPRIGEVRVHAAGWTLYTLEGATAIRLGPAATTEVDRRFERFDATWATLAADERAQARTVHLEALTRPDRVIVTLADIRGVDDGESQAR